MENNSIPVVICGPNLNDQSKGQFHVHAAGCSDLVRMASREPEYRNGWTMMAASPDEVGDNIYEDHIAEGSMNPGEGTSDCHFFPCVKFPSAPAEQKETVPAMDDRNFEALRKLRDEGVEPSAECLALLRRKHLVSKRGLAVTGYGQTRLERWLAGSQPKGARTEAGKARAARKSAAGSQAARRLGYGIRQISGEWFVVNNRMQPVHVAGAPFASASSAQPAADRLNAAA